MKTGKIDISKLSQPPLKSEFLAAKFLATKGKIIEFIEPSQTKNARTPDMKMDGLEWEIKCPRANSKYTIEHAFRSALGQSENVIFDLRSNKTPAQAQKKVEKKFQEQKKAKRVLIINRGGKILDLKR
jgi:hypothetical protein